jgi:hypothetical protein
MNIRIALYFLGSFFLTFASGARDGLTAAGWVALVAFSLGSGVTAVIAYLDRSSGQPPQSIVPGKTVAAVVAIVIILAFSGCSAFEKTHWNVSASVQRQDQKFELGFSGK